MTNLFFFFIDIPFLLFLLSVYLTELKSLMKQNVIVIAAALLIGACAGRGASDSILRCVEVTSPVSVSQNDSYLAAGMVQEAHKIKLGFKTAGQIEKICVHEGARVEKGQLLAKLDSKDYQLGLDAAQIQYDQLSKEVERMTALLEKNGISQNDYDKATSGLRQLGIQLEAQRRKVEYTSLFAPVDGYIVAVNYSPAEMVDAGTPVLDFIDVNGMEVLVDIPVSLYLRRRSFGSIFCTTSYGERMNLKLLSIAPRADGNQLYQMRLAFASRVDARLTSGMNVEVSLSMRGENRDGAYTLPLRSVFSCDGEECVWVVGEDSALELRKVRTSGVDGENIVVVYGLDGSENVVRAGAANLQPGEKVKVLPCASKTNVGGLL